MSQGNKKQSKRLLARARLLLGQLPGGSRRWIHDGYRVVLLVSAALLIDLAFPVQSGTDLPTLREGMVASEDVIAPTTFPVYKSEPELTQERAEAAGADYIVVGRSITSAPVPAEALARVRAELAPSDV